jgi:hypothetical protein
MLNVAVLYSLKCPSLLSDEAALRRGFSLLVMLLFQIVRVCRQPAAWITLVE